MKDKKISLERRISEGKEDAVAQIPIVIDLVIALWLDLQASLHLVAAWSGNAQEAIKALETMGVMSVAFVLLLKKLLYEDKAE
ncbi:MAG: hypothetical protein ABI758_06535 [Candidatus Woesebacteria bacterium]